MSESLDFERRPSGLIVPAEHAKDREAWTRDELRLIQRALKLADSRGVDLFIGCPLCKQPMALEAGDDGGFVMECRHKVRHFSKRF